MSAGGEFQFDELEPSAPRGPTPGQWAWLVVRYALRRKLVALLVFALSFAAILAYYRTRLPMYRVETKILTQRQPVPTSIRTANDDPTRNAWELVHRKENLRSLVVESGALDAPPLDVLQGPAAALLRGALPGAKREPRAQDPEEALVLRLDKALEVSVDGGTITISLDWPVPHQAYRIVDGALQNFLEARHVQEITATDEVLSVLSGRAAAARERLQRTLTDVQREQERRSARVVATVPPSVQSRPQESEEVTRLFSMVESKRRAIQDVEEFRRRRLADLQAQLETQRGVFSEAHPTVIGLKQDIAALSRESPQIAALQEEERKLRAEYQARLGKEVPSAGAVPAPSVVPLPPQRVGSSEEDSRVREARLQYESIMDRVNAAQVELDAIRAAFKFRYNVVWPPEEPVDPVSPKPVKILGAGLLASLLLALFAAAAPDLVRGPILARWQLERGLGIPVLATAKPRRGR